MKTKESKSLALEKLKGNWTKAVLITLVNFLFYYVINIFSGILNDSLSLIISIGSLIIEIPITYGTIYAFMKIYNGEEVKVFDFFSLVFSNFTRAWGVTFKIFLKLLLPIIIFIVLYVGIPIISATSFMANLGIFSIIFGILGIVLLFAALIKLIDKTLLYSISEFIAIDKPNLNTDEVVAKSETIMTRNTSKLVWLVFSFIGWLLLAALTYGIGYFWLVPYINLSIIAFYKKIIQNNSNQNF